MATQLVAKPEDRSAMLDLVARLATDATVDPAKFLAILNIQRELMADHARQQFNEAFARLQPQLPRVKKGGEVSYPAEKGKPELKKAFNYAKYEDIDIAIRPLLNGEGFALSYNTVPQPNGTILVTGTLGHREGHEKTVQIGPLPLDTSGGKNNLQAAASTFSYGKRYCMTMLLNLVFEGEDDDGVKGGLRLIDAAAVTQLETLAKEVGASLEAFCRYLGVESLADIPAAKYAEAVNALMARRRKRQALPQDPPPGAARAPAAVPQTAVNPAAPPQGRADYRTWWLGPFFHSLRKAQTQREFKDLCKASDALIEAYYATLSPAARIAAQKELDDLAKGLE